MTVTESVQTHAAVTVAFGDDASLWLECLRARENYENQLRHIVSVFADALAPATSGRADV